MRSSSSQASLRSILSKELSEIQAAGTYKTERVITTPQAAAIRVQEQEGSLLNFCANNYLGLSVRERLIFFLVEREMLKTSCTYGSGCIVSRNGRDSPIISAFVLIDTTNIPEFSQTSSLELQMASVVPMINFHK